MNNKENSVMLNDVDYLTLLINHLKMLEKNMTTALTEASNEYVCDKYKNMFLNLTEMQRRCYELMFSQDYYKIDEAEESKVKKTLKDLESKFKEL